MFFLKWHHLYAKQIGQFSKGIYLTCLMVDIFEDYDSIDIPMHHIAILMRYLNKNAQYKMLLM